MDDEIRTLERRLQANPDDAQAKATLDRLRRRQGDESFAVTIAGVLNELERTDHRDALLVAQLCRDVTSKNWGAAFRFQDEQEFGRDHYGPPRDGLYVTVRCFWDELEDRHRIPPARYDFTFERRAATPAHPIMQTRTVVRHFRWPTGDEVRAWASSVIVDDGKRVQRWLELLETMGARHVLVVDPSDSRP